MFPSIYKAECISCTDMICLNVTNCLVTEYVLYMFYSWMMSKSLNSVVF